MTSIYRVQAGDTVNALISRFGVSLAAFLEMNPQVTDPDKIDVGMPLNVPDPAIHNTEGDLPDWYVLARQEMEAGVEEISGEQDNPRIVEYHQCTSLKATDDETAWCSSFVNWCMTRSGIAGTNSAAARSWLNWGQALDSPKEGCVTIFSRGNKPWQGHVALYTGETSGHILVLGGNQGNEVNISSYRKSRLLGYRWPKEV